MGRKNAEKTGGLIEKDMKKAEIKGKSYRKSRNMGRKICRKNEKVRLKRYIKQRGTKEEFVKRAGII